MMEGIWVDTYNCGVTLDWPWQPVLACVIYRKDRAS